MVAPLHTVVSNTPLADACWSAVCALGCIAGIGPRQTARLARSAPASINATVQRACCCVWRQRLAYGAAIAGA
eukprot:6837914-Prymnesium_polylepis.1